MMLLASETLHQLRLFVRRPAAVFFVIAMPLILLIIFTELFGNDLIEEHNVTTAQFYSPALAVFGVVMACYTYLAISTANARDMGILKRVRGTPLPPAIYVAARIISVSVIALVAAVVVVAAGVAFYGIQIYWVKMPAAFVVLCVGAMAFAGLGMAVTALCRSSETVQAITNATLLPIAFVSDIFIRPFREVPIWMKWAGDIFPLKHFSLAFGGAFRPDMAGHGFLWSGGDGLYAMLPHLAIVAAWGIVAAFVAAKFFRWDPIAR